MKSKSFKSAAFIIVIGLVLSIAACLVMNVELTPAVTEHSFPYSVTYKLNGEIKTLEGIYTCKYDGYSDGESPRDRYYTGEFMVNGETTFAHTYTIAEKDGAELYIITIFNDCYLMNDRLDQDYEPSLEEPSLEAVDKEGHAYEESNMPSEFTAEIISWEYPEPIENSFVFSGFSLLHVESMIVMAVVGLLVAVACAIFVKKDPAVTYEPLDKLSVLLNFAVCVVAIPFIVFVTAMMQLTTETDSFIYQMFLCVPAIMAFTVAASIALRRSGFTKSGFIVQFVGPVLFFVPVFVESLIMNIFG